MTAGRSLDYLIGLVRELTRLPRETEWVEFKHNNADPQEIGEYISALANAAALNGKPSAFQVWGIEDGTHAILGTSFDPMAAKKGNEPLENWLLRLLTPKIDFRFYPVTVDGQSIVVLEIQAAYRHPVSFAGHEYIRIGPVKKALKDAPDRERALWRCFDRVPFEDMVAKERVASDEVVALLDYPSFFELQGWPLPGTPDGILSALANDGLIRPCLAGGWDITNLGAILFARKLSAFPGLGRKATRVVQYKGAGRTETSKETPGERGYASGFAGLISFLNAILPANEVIGQALRKNVPMYPELAVRELVANALIHQDFFVTGAGPMIEVFSNRLEITNPGEPLVDVRRFVDTPPKSRNEKLASLMRRLSICEERGSGIDKVVSQVEFYQLPAPLFETAEGSTRTILFAHKALNDMDSEERIRACYLHACLKRVNREFLTNTTLRERFGIETHNSARASRLIKEAAEAKVIVPYDPDAAPNQRKYVPWWADPQGAPPA